MSKKSYLDLNHFLGKITKEHRRKLKNLSLEVLGQRIKVNAIERGMHLPNTITLLKLSHELGFHLNDLLPKAIEIINRCEKNKM